jgi:hypothetical protein
MIRFQQKNSLAFARHPVLSPHLANEAFGLLVQGIRGDLVAPQVMHRGLHSSLKPIVTWGSPILENPHMCIYIYDLVKPMGLGVPNFRKPCM